MADYFQGLEYAVDLAATIAVTSAISSVQDQYNALATNYYNDYSLQRNYYYNNFQQQGELPFANEQFGIFFFYTPDYVGVDNIGLFPPGVWNLFNPELSNRASNLGVYASSGYWQTYVSRYTPNGATPIQENSGTFTAELASIYDDWNSYQNRYEEHKRDIFNERRWASQMGSLSFGVKQAYAVERGLATSFETFDRAQGNLVSADDTILNGLATSYGFSKMQRSVREDLGTLPGYQSGAFILPGLQ